MKVQSVKVLLAAIGLSSMLIYSIPVEASEGIVREYGEEIMPLYENSFKVRVTLVFSGGKAKCYGKVEGRAGKECSVTTTLQKKTSAGWTNIKTWKSSGQEECSAGGSATASKGVNYRVKVVGKSGTESDTRYSATKSY